MRFAAMARSPRGPTSWVTARARKLLKATLAEEEKTDKALSDLAEDAVNQAAEAA